LLLLLLLLLLFSHLPAVYKILGLLFKKGVPPGCPFEIPTQNSKAQNNQNNTRTRNARQAEKEADKEEQEPSADPA
jgi:hypothetical protein